MLIQPKCIPCTGNREEGLGWGGAAVQPPQEHDHYLPYLQVCLRKAAAAL